MVSDLETIELKKQRRREISKRYREKNKDSINKRNKEYLAKVKNGKGPVKPPKIYNVIKDGRKVCSKCSLEKVVSDFNKNCTNPYTGLFNYCKECANSYFRGYRRSAEEKEEVISRRRQSCREYARKNKQKMKENHDRWIENNRHKPSEYSGKRRAYRIQATVEWANDFFMEEAYNLAKLRTEMFGFKWQVDHIVPLNSPIVCGLHWEQNFQVIPASENLSKGNRYWPDMP